MSATQTSRDRWLSAICYLSILVFIPLLSKHKSPFLAKHCRQGFALFVVEAAGIILIAMIDGTLGMIPLLGFLLVLLLRLVYFLGFLALSLMGFFRALFGEEWRIPYLDDLADRLPIE